MIRIEAVRSEQLSRKHNAVVSLIYWHDQAGRVRIGTQFHRDGRTLFKWTPDSSLYLRLEMALTEGIPPFEALMAKPVAHHRREHEAA